MSQCKHTVAPAAQHAYGVAHPKPRFAGRRRRPAPSPKPSVSVPADLIPSVNWLLLLLLLHIYRWLTSFAHTHIL